MTRSSENIDSEVRLGRAHEVISGFITSCSHSLRGPLKSIEGLTNLLRMGDTLTPAERTTFLQLIQDTAHKMEGMLDEMEHFLENNQRALSIKEVPLNTLVKKLVGSFSETARKRGIDLTVGQAANGTFATDPHRVRLVLTNLLSNAVQFHDPQKTKRQIHVELKDMPTGVCILVEDNGIGIPEEHIGSIFDIFFRASERSAGAGIGLYVVRHALEKLHGHIQAESVVGIGSRFTVTLPDLSSQVAG